MNEESIYSRDVIHKTSIQSNETNVSCALKVNTDSEPSTCDFNKDHKITSCQNLQQEAVENINANVENFSMWEEEKEVKIKPFLRLSGSRIEDRMPSFLTNSQPNDNLSDNKEYTYWSSLGLLKNKRTDKLYLGPNSDDLRDTNSNLSIYNEKTINVISNSPDSINKSIVVNENEMTDDIPADNMMVEIPLGTGSEKTVSLNDEPVEKHKLNKEKKTTFLRMFQNLFGCFYKKNKN